MSEVLPLAAPHKVASPALWQGFMASGISAASYGAGVVFVRWAYAAGVTPGAGIFLRYLIGALILGAYIAARSAHRRGAPQYRKQLFFLGLILHTTMGTSWFLALQFSPAWLVSLFTAIYPLSISLGSWLILREKFDARLLPPLAAVLCGGVLLFWQPLGGTAFWGGLMMVINVLAYTAFVIWGQHWVSKAAPEASVFYILLGATVGTALLITANAVFGEPLEIARFYLDFAPSGWLGVAGYALISTVVATIMLWGGIRILGTARAAIVGALEPVSALLFSVTILGEQMMSLQLAGGILILAALVWMQLGGRQKNPSAGHAHGVV